MQGYHGFPCHYFNMTPQAVETFIVDDFELEQSHIPLSGSPAMALDNLLRKFIEGLPLKDRLHLSSLKVSEFLIELTQVDRHQEMFEAMSEHVRRSLAASTCVIGKKPLNYLPKPSLKGIRRDYYAARVGVTQRYYEIEHYRSRVLEKDTDYINPTPSGTLADLLYSARVTDTMNASSWENASKALGAIDSELTKIRNVIIGRYLRIEKM